MFDITMFETWDGTPNRQIDLKLHNFFRDSDKFKYRFSANAAIGYDQTEIIVFDIPDNIDPDFAEYIRDREPDSVMVLPRYTDRLDLVMKLMDRHLPRHNKVMVEGEEENTCTLQIHGTDDDLIISDTETTLIKACVMALIHTVIQIERETVS